MQPKIIWKRIGSILRFSYDTSGNLGLDSTCFAVGKHMAYLCCILNSLMGHYMFKDSPKTGTGDLLVSVQAIEPILIPMNKEMECLFEDLLKEVLEHDSKKAEKEINRKHSKKCTFYTLRFGCSFAAVNTIKPQLL